MLLMLLVVVDLLKMLKAMRMDLTFDHEGMDKPLYMDQPPHTYCDPLSM